MPSKLNTRYQCDMKLAYEFLKYVTYLAAKRTGNRMLRTGKRALCFLRICGSMILVFCKFHINTLITNSIQLRVSVTFHFLILDLVHKEVAKNCYFVRFFSSFAKI